MRSRAVRSLVTIAALSLLAATFAPAQSGPSPSEGRPAVSSLVDHLHYREPTFTGWHSLSQINPKGKLFVITLADSTHRHTCQINSITADELICKGLTGTRTYKAQDIAALIIPGYFAARLGFGIGFTAATAAVAWRAAVFAATCTPCAVGLGIAALILFVADLGVQAADPDNDSLLYLAPGQSLHVKLRE